ncbi:MAG: glycosyltransferase family 4 protein [Paeniclostridium sordellii]|nr:glycosyltransferase family 4 protein [Paeniclostridium sordellii]
MKICVIGPVYTSYYFGGVATFTESLGDGFVKNGHDVRIITDYSDKDTTINGTSIISTFKKKARKNYKMPKLIAKEILKFNPDLVISSLEYGLANKLVKRENTKIKFIHYLHAFPSVKRSKLNNFFVNNITRYICKNSDYVISNSSLTAVINSEIFNIPSDDIINVGLGYDFINKIDKSTESSYHDDKKHILFAGRLVKEKNVDCIIKAFGNINNEKIILDIIGDGKEKDKLETMAKGISSNIIFHGKIPPIEIPNYLKRSDLFISLNPHEPYGIVYLEAMSANTAIVCPKTGGQMDTLIDYKDRVKFVNPYDISDISSKIEEALNLNFNELSKVYIDEHFSYRKVANDIEEFYKKLNNKVKK